MLTTIERNGEGQTTCKGCAVKGLGTGARHWDCMLYNVEIDGEPMGIYCSSCIRELREQEEKHHETDRRG